MATRRKPASGKVPKAARAPASSVLPGVQGLSAAELRTYRETATFVASGDAGLSGAVHTAAATFLSNFNDKGEWQGRTGGSGPAKDLQPFMDAL